MQRREQILRLLKHEPYRIGHWLGFKDLTELHNEWLRSFLYKEDDQTLLGHRGSYKTTVLALFLAINIFKQPNRNTMFFRKTDTDVSEVMRQVAKILNTGCIKNIVKELYGKEFVVTKATDSEIHTNLCTTAKGVSQIVGLGIGTSITGKHADVVVTDDIVNIKDRTSRAERERTKLQYMELQNIKNRNGRFINTGTPWHKEDAISLMPNIRRYDCYSTELISRDKLKELRSSMSDSLFAANYELKHIADKDAMFKEPQFVDDIELIYGGIAHIDAAYGGEDATAYTVFKQIDGELIGFGMRWEKHVDDCLDEIKVWHERLRAGSVACERNADKGYLAKELEKRGFYVHTYSESTNKFVKISSYLRSKWSSIRWLDITAPDYISEILDYNEFAVHDDCPDSAASLIRRLESKVKYNKVKGGI